MQNCIEDDMIKRNWQYVSVISWKFEKKSEIKIKILLKMDKFRDFLPIFCQTAGFLPGGPLHTCKIFTGAVLIFISQFYEILDL